MRVRLLEPHIIDDTQMPKGAILDLPLGYAVTPVMEGLDADGRAAVAYARLKVWGRYPWPYGLRPPSGPPLDDPPIPRPLDDNQPVFRYVGAPEYL